MTTIKDYENALDLFYKQMQGIHSAITSVYLYGSMARGEIIPGQSDLDFWIFLSDTIFLDEDAFKETLNSLADAFKTLKESNLPIAHAFCYYSEQDVTWLPAALVPNLKNARTSKLLLGRDVREKMASTGFSKALYQSSYFFEMRRFIFLPLTVYIDRDDLQEQEIMHIVGSLKYMRYVPEAACVALNQWPGEIEALALLKQLIPEINIDIFHIIAEFRAQQNYISSIDTVAILLKQALSMVEEINSKLVEKMNQQVA